MKVGLIYTSTTPELIELVEQEVKGQLGEDVELYSLQDPSILADVREAGYVTTAPAARLIGMYMQAAQNGVEAMLNLCSSVGEVADCAQDVAKYIGGAHRPGGRGDVPGGGPPGQPHRRDGHPAHHPGAHQEHGAPRGPGGR